MKSIFRKNSPLKGNRTKIITAVLGLVILIGVIIAVILITKNRTEETYCEEIENPAAEILEIIAEDVSTPGLYVYNYKDEHLVLLTYGQQVGLSMHVTPRISEQAIYFAVDSTRVSETSPACEYKLFKTNTILVSTDLIHLRNPAYGVGSEGFDVALITESDNNEYFIVPLTEKPVIDRVLYATPETDVSTGLCRFTYEVKENGAYITSCTKLDSYDLWIAIQSYNDESKTIEAQNAPNGVSFTADVSTLTENELYWLTKFVAKDNSSVLVSLSDRDGAVYITHVDLPDGLADDAEQSGDSDAISAQEDAALQGENAATPTKGNVG